MPINLRLEFAIVLTVGLALALASQPAAVRASATFVVDSAGDQADATPGDGQCATALATCTLRAAIQESNALTGADVINFNIGGGGVQTIAPSPALPAITGPVTIDGATQPGYTTTPIVEIDGDDSYPSCGVTVQGGASVLRALVVNRASGAGVGNVCFSGLGGSTLEDSFIGIDVTGSSALGGGYGVRIQGSPDNVIRRNVISGSTAVNLDARGLGADRNIVVSNLIGLNAAGSAPVIADGVGIHMDGIGNRIGGPTPNDANVVSGNISGMQVTGASVLGNLVGTDPSGLIAIPNLTDGVMVSHGGIVERNIIAGNGRDGLRIGPGTVARGNVVGANANGDPLPNGRDGVHVRFGSSVLGGFQPGEANLIAFNAGHGVAVGALGLPSSQDLIVGNVIHDNGSAGISVGPDSVWVAIFGNSIFNNGGLGIDNSSGGNTELPPPVQTAPGSGTACAMCTIHVYGDTVDEGEYYAGSTTASMTGNWSFPGPILGAFVTATAMDGNDNTSEFSAPFANTDNDGDGCSDAEELGPNPVLGGDRNPNDYWDFFNVTTDRSIDLSDAIDILAYFGDAGTSADGNKRDRAVMNMAFPYLASEANDGVDLSDAITVLLSFGHDCSAGP